MHNGGNPVGVADLADTQIMALIAFSKYMCEDGKIEFRSCLSGKGKAGENLEEALEKIFGEGNVILYDELCWTFFDVYIGSFNIPLVDKLGKIHEGVKE